MSPSPPGSIPRCAAISANVWPRSAARMNTKRAIERTRFFFMHVTLIPFVLLIAAAAPPAAALQIQPRGIVLTGPQGSQRLLLIATAAGKTSADLTREAQFTSSNPQVATVDSRGV